MYYIYGVSENPNVNLFDKPRHLTDQKHVHHLSSTHIRVAQTASCMIFSIYVANKQC